MTDLDALNDARDQVLFEGKTNSLVEWTLTDEWTNVKRHDKPIPRGLLRKCGFLFTLNSCKGEIDAT